LFGTESAVMGIEIVACTPPCKGATLRQQPEWQFYTAAHNRHASRLPGCEAEGHNTLHELQKERSCGFRNGEGWLHAGGRAPFRIKSRLRWAEEVGYDTRVLEDCRSLRPHTSVKKLDAFSLVIIEYLIDFCVANTRSHSTTWRVLPRDHRSITTREHGNEAVHDDSMRPL